MSEYITENKNKELKHMRKHLKKAVALLMLTALCTTGFMNENTKIVKAASSGGVYVESCGMCNGGNIYYTIERVSRHWAYSEMCEHGCTKGTDDTYKIHSVMKYSCDKCSYGWDESLYRYETECHGYD